jgi:hypothetical protein
VTSNATTGAYTLSLPNTVNVGNLQTNSITVGSVQIDTTGATTNQVLKFNGTKFIPAADAGGNPSGVSYNETIGDGLNTSFVINHNLNTTEVSVEILDYSSTYEIIDALWETTSANSVTVSFAMPPASNSRRVIIDGPGDRDYYNTVVGDGVSSTIVINHNLGSRNIVPVLKSVSSPYQVIESLVYATDINSATLVFSFLLKYDEYDNIRRGIMNNENSITTRICLIFLLDFEYKLLIKPEIKIVEIKTNEISLISSKIIKNLSPIKSENKSP